MGTRTKVLVALAVLGLIDAVAPGLPILALVLIYVVIEKPAWFHALVREVYAA